MTNTFNTHKNFINKATAYLADGTYEVRQDGRSPWVRPISYQDGYQVSCYTIGMRPTAREYAVMLDKLVSASDDGRISLGVWSGTGELSCHIADKETAILLAKAFNQYSIWDWKESQEILTGGTGKAENRAILYETL